MTIATPILCHLLSSKIDSESCHYEHTYNLPNIQISLLDSKYHYSVCMGCVLWACAWNERTCACALRAQKRSPGILFYHPLSYLLKTVSLSESDDKMRGCKSPESLCLLPLLSAGHAKTWLYLALYVNVGVWTQFLMLAQWDIFLSMDVALHPPKYLIFKSTNLSLLKHFYTQAKN